MRPSPFMGDRHDIVSVEPGNPAAGAGLVWNTPDKVVVQIVAVQISLTTSVVVGDRHVRVYISASAVVGPPFSPAMILQTANLTWVYYFTLGIAPVDLTGSTLEVFQPLGCCYQIQNGSSLIVNADGIDAGDQFAAANIRYFLWDKA